MLLTISIAMLCTLGVAFYCCFLFALCKECRHHRICYLVRSRTYPHKLLISDDGALRTSTPRAA